MQNFIQRKLKNLLINLKDLKEKKEQLQENLCRDLI